jgi:hypothetical protein
MKSTLNAEESLQVRVYSTNHVAGSGRTWDEDDQQGIASGRAYIERKSFVRWKSALEMRRKLAAEERAIDGDTR